MLSLGLNSRFRRANCVYINKTAVLLFFFIVGSVLHSSAKTIKFNHSADSSSQPVSIQFYLKQAGFVTLVIETRNGVRVRNLVSDTWFRAGKNVIQWDGLDDIGRDPDAAHHGAYKIPAHFVLPGAYRVRGLIHSHIIPHYEFSVYRTGNPPWNTKDYTGGWLADHTPPQSALFVPANQSPTHQPAVFLGSYITESGDGLAWVDLDGRKLGGKRWIGGNWTGAPFLARDAGKNALPAINAYVASVFAIGKNRHQNELRITGLTNGKDKPVMVYELDTLNEKFDQSTELSGLAVNNNVAVVSLNKRNRLLFIDVLQNKIIDTLPINAPGGSAFDYKGRLLIVSGNEILRSDSVPTAKKIPVPKRFITIGLEAPYAITFDQEGNLYVSDRGNSNQVKVFNAAGKLIRVIGNPGLMKAGPYDPLHMNNPAGITIDSKDHLWVAEEDNFPKRVSIWTLDGKFINAFYGPGKYGGGGTLDSHDTTRFYYAEAKGAMEFKLDWQKKTFQLKSVYYRATPSDLSLGWREAAPELPLYRGKQRYFSNCHNSSPTNGTPTTFLFIEKNGIALPVAAAGNAKYWDVLKETRFIQRWPPEKKQRGIKPTDDAFFIWSDTNGDGQVQPDEVTIRSGIASGITLMPDFSFCVADLDGKAVRYAPVSFNNNGVPQYNIDNGEILVSGILPAVSTGGDQVLVADSGQTIVTLGIKPFDALSICGSKNGVPMWSYPDLWPGLHASHSAPLPAQNGELIGTTRLLGGLFHVRGSDAGPCWAINGNLGNVYLFTSDGLFITTLFTDMRRGNIWPLTTAEPGLRIDSISLGPENFWPTITQASNGSIYMVDGARSSIISFNGMESIRRLPDLNITITEKDLINAHNYLVKMEAGRQETINKDTLNVAMRLSPPKVDGKLDNWTWADWADIDRSGVKAYFNSTSKPYNVTGALAIAAGNLYVGYRTDISKLQNSGELPNAPFLTGDALDLMIGTDPLAKPGRQTPVAGDIRVVVTLINNKPLAVLYKAVVKGTKTNTGIPFSSPTRIISFDQVDDISSKVQFAYDKGNYELAIPLSVLGLNPKNGMLINGDIGILRGIPGTTYSRSYWSDKSAGNTADVPSEAELLPQLWGTWKFIAQ